MIGSLIIYSSTDGHTKTICKRIINFLKDGNIARLVSLNEAKNLDLSEFEQNYNRSQYKIWQTF